MVYQKNGDKTRQREPRPIQQPCIHPLNVAYNSRIYSQHNARNAMQPSRLDASFNDW